MKKMVLTLILPLFLASLLTAQSLAELSQKEKERRESLKGKRPVPVTNADLSRLRKKAGLETPALPPQPTPENQPAADNSQPEPVSPAEGSDSGVPEGMADGYRTALEGRYNQAKEYADLLELKMAALWQEFYSMDDMTSRDSIQQDMAATFDKLEKARADENAVKKELDDYLARIGKGGASPQ